MLARMDRQAEVLARYANFPRPDLIWHVVSHEVTLNVPTTDAFAKIREWAIQNVGEPRPLSPFYEALSGWLDYHDEEWAWRHGKPSDPQGTYHFWFFDVRKAVLFALRWKGET
jgi:hypothetical protein